MTTQLRVQYIFQNLFKIHYFLPCWKTFTVALFQRFNAVNENKKILSNGHRPLDKIFKQASILLFLQL